MDISEIYEWWKEIDWDEYQHLCAKNEWISNDAHGPGWVNFKYFNNAKYIDANGNYGRKDGAAIVSPNYKVYSPDYHVDISSGLGLQVYAYNTGIIAFYDNNILQHHPYMPANFNILNYMKTGKFAESELITWAIKNKPRGYDVMAWMKEMDMDVYNLSPEDKAMCILKWN